MIREYKQRITKSIKKASRETGGDLSLAKRLIKIIKSDYLMNSVMAGVKTWFEKITKRNKLGEDDEYDN